MSIIASSSTYMPFELYLFFTFCLILGGIFVL